MPRVEFEGIKINLNSILLALTLSGMLISVGIQWQSKGTDTTMATAANTREIDRVDKAHEETRKELRDLRTQATATAVLKADMDNLKAGMARIERTLEARLK